MVRTTGTQAQNWQSIIGYQYWTPSGGAALPTVSNVGGLYLSTPELIGPASGNIPLGRLRYFCRNSPQQSPTYPYSIPSTPTREVVYIGTSTTSLVIEWEPGVTP